LRKVSMTPVEPLRWLPNISGFLVTLILRWSKII
jgi:hypothetical protein